MVQYTYAHKNEQGIDTSSATGLDQEADAGLASQLWQLNYHPVQWADQEKAPDAVTPYRGLFLLFEKRKL